MSKGKTSPIKVLSTAKLTVLRLVGLAFNCAAVCAPISIPSVERTAVRLQSEPRMGERQANVNPIV